MLEYIQNLPQVITELFKQNPWGQWIWMVAFLISIVNFSIWKNKSFIFIMMIASGFWWAHFMLIGALAASAVQFFDVIKNLFALKFEKNKYVALFFILAYILIWFFTYKDVYSLIPILTSIFWVILVFYVRWVWLNIWYLWIISLWFIYNLYNNSVWWVMSDVVLWVVWIFWIIRILFFEKKKKWKH